MSTEIKGWRIPDEVRRAIAAEPASIGRRQLAAKYGVSDCTITNIRREFGVPLNPRGGPGIWSAIPSLWQNERRWPLRRRTPAPLAWAMEEAA